MTLSDDVIKQLRTALSHIHEAEIAVANALEPAEKLLRTATDLGMAEQIESAGLVKVGVQSMKTLLVPSAELAEQMINEVENMR